MAYTTNGVPYVQPTDAVSDYPNTSLELANYIDNSRARYVGQYHHNFGTVNAGNSNHNLTAFAFNGEVGDVWTANFSGDCGAPPGGGAGGCTVKLYLASGIPLYHPTENTTFRVLTNDEAHHATYTWKATTANDYLVVAITENLYGVTNFQIVANGVMNLGGI